LIVDLGAFRGSFAPVFEFVMVDTEKYVERGREFFVQGYNCSQSVVLALAPLYDLDEALASKMVVGFGAGIGRMRETCGSATGMFFLAGLETTKTIEGLAGGDTKSAAYEAVQLLADRFKAETGSLICRELLSGSFIKNPVGTTPDPRTAEYYKKRPCIKMVETAIRIYCTWLNEK